MTDFEYIRPYHDDEVPIALEEYVQHPMFKALLHFTFPDESTEAIMSRVSKCRSIQDFQKNIIFHSVDQVIKNSTEGLTTSGFETLKTSEPYFYISNHRDIILDTSLLNYTLSLHNLTMTASAIGDNLVKKSFLLALSKLNRNFLVKRGLPPREMLESSKKLSQYIRKTFGAGRSIWMAHREGRTKDGNDRTQQGVLKMIAMARGEKAPMEYLKGLNMVAVSISYEYDPTDLLKVPEVVAEREDVAYVKSNNEDFNSILRGALGNKKRLHVAARKLEPRIFDDIDQLEISANDKLLRLCAAIDAAIHQSYKLWPPNYIAYDMLRDANRFGEHYTKKDKRQFERRVTRRVKPGDDLSLESFLLMYANPVINKEKL